MGHMTRRLRNDFPGAVHHVMNRGVDRRDVFFSDADRDDFGRLLAEIHSRFGIDVLAYCLMGNHYHLLLRSQQGELAAAMQYLGITYTRHTNDRVGRDGPLFRGRYHALPVETDRYLLWATRYIHLNPLDLASVRSADEFRWSSYRAYLGYRRAPAFLEMSTVLGIAGSRRELVRLTDGDFGGLGSWTAEDIRQLITFAILDDEAGHRSNAAGRPRLERTVAVLVADRLRGSPVSDQLLRTLEFPNLEAENAAVRRAQRRHRDPLVGRVVDRVLATIGALRAAA